MLAPVAASLKEFQARLTDVEKERVQIATEMRSQVRTVRDAGEAMRREAATLVNALRKPQVRGSWGETTLKNVARLSGMVERCDFELQVTTRSEDGTQRPDMKVNLADGKHVFVDSKVPLMAFLDAAGSEDEQEKLRHLDQFARHVRKHVDDLSTKQYWKAAESPEFVVLFLPSEEFFSAALDQMPDLYEYAVKKDVVIATPTTLIGMLRAISYGWKQAALADKAAEVFKLGRELHERLGQMGAKFDKLGRALGSTVNAYNETVGHGREPGAGHGAAVPRPPGQRDASSRPSSAWTPPCARRRRQELGSPSGPGRRRAGGGGRARRSGATTTSAGRPRLPDGVAFGERRLLRPVHGPLLRAPRSAVRRPGRPACRRPGAGRRVRARGPDRRAGRRATARTGSTRSTPPPSFVAARASRLPGVDVRQGAAESLPYARRDLRRGARPARRPLHEGPGSRVWRRWPG